MAKAKEIRTWIGIPRHTSGTETFPGLEGEIRSTVAPGASLAGTLFFDKPEQPSDLPETQYLRCPGEQRIVVLTEIAAQLAELNDAILGAVVLLRIVVGAVVGALVSLALWWVR